jgi:hypothetical protein
MTDLFQCGDTGALVGYLYDECEPDVRTSIAKHLAACVSCSREVEQLGWTRRQLGAWAPPPATLGFQIPTPAQSASEPRLPWWRAPLPAWAQAAAAVLVFGVGLSVGMSRGSASQAPVVSNPPASAPVVETASRADLSQLEQKLRAEMAQGRPVAEAAPSPVNEEAIMRRVQALVEQSEERQRREFTLRAVEMARDFETQRRLDLASVRETVGQLQGVTGAEVRQQREAIDRINEYLIRVSQGR